MTERQIGVFGRFIAEQGLKSTRQRNDIVKIFLKSEGHLSVEDLHHLVQKVNTKIGYATVYRTLKLLAQSGLAVERKFDDGQTRYEHLHPEEHHDHLICMNCGKIIEFEDKEIEALQEEVARKLEFRVVSHNLDMYGYCRNCDKSTIEQQESE